MSPNHHQSLPLAHIQGGVAQALLWKHWLWIQLCFHSSALLWGCAARPSPQGRCWATWNCIDHWAVRSFLHPWKDIFPSVSQLNPPLTVLVSHICVGKTSEATWSHRLPSGDWGKSVRGEWFFSASPQSYGLLTSFSLFLYTHSWRVGMSRDTLTPYWEWILSSH